MTRVANDWTQVQKNANSKLLDIVSIADVDTC